MKKVIVSFSKTWKSICEKVRMDFALNSISTLQNDIVWSEQGYFDYEVNNEQWQFMQKLFQNY